MAHRCRSSSKVISDWRRAAYVLAFRVALASRVFLERRSTPELLQRIIRYLLPEFMICKGADRQISQMLYLPEFQNRDRQNADRQISHRLHLTMRMTKAHDKGYCKNCKRKVIVKYALARADIPWEATQKILDYV